ncbi:MAG: hypothetical protein HY815_15375 [Candidatus Riflebacteria bacterium]|nr:hypothetical protein [Candidatus Riflebacteria bacterium]
MGDHIPLAGEEPSVLAASRPTKAVTTVHRNSRQGLKDLRGALDANHGEIDALKPGEQRLIRFRTSEPRLGYNGVRQPNGSVAVEEVSRDSVTVNVQRLPDGRLHSDHFSPRVGD